MKKQMLKLGFATILLSAAFISCSKTETLPPIGGYNNAGEVASTNLVAYWGMDGDGKESKSGKAPSKSVNATYTAGLKGSALSLAKGYISFDEITALNSLPNATISAWVNVKNNSSAPTCFFTLTRPNEWAGNINLMSETGWKTAASDTMVVKGLVVTKVAGNDSWQDSRNEPNNGGVQAAKVAGKWAHLVITWDGATSMFKVYANGVKVSNPDWEKRGTTGPLNFTTPTKAVIGAWGTNLTTTSEAWQIPMTGQIDELRVYNKALTDADISALYQLESAGR
jgi:hypothetical protein